MENIYTTVKPFYILSKVLGSFPMTFEGPPEKGFLRTKCQDILATGCSFIVLTVLALYKLTSENVFQCDSFIMIKSWDVSIVVGFFVFLMHFCVQVAVRKNIKKFLRRLHNFDQEVKFRSLRCSFLIPV